MRGFIELISQRETEDNQVDSIEVEEKYEDVVAKMENEMEILNAFQG